jgi:hypothetical protein
MNAPSSLKKLTAQNLLVDLPPRLLHLGGQDLTKMSLAGASHQLPVAACDARGSSA